MTVYELTSSLAPVVNDVLANWLRRRSRARSYSATSASAREVLPVNGEVPFTMAPSWSAEVQRRILHLAKLPEGWDTYSGRRLQTQAVQAMIEVLLSLAHAIQRAPMISLTSEGGLIAEWENDEKLVQLIVDPQMPPLVSFEDSLSGYEWDGPLRETPLLEKWLWQASGH